LAKHDLEEVYDRLISLLSDCGVAFVLLPHIDGSFLHGASFRDGGKVVLGMTVRDRDADKFCSV
jgi:HTH-type transcriptional regulator/antitoxin HigA